MIQKKAKNQLLLAQNKNTKASMLNESLGFLFTKTFSAQCVE